MTAGWEVGEGTTGALPPGPPAVILAVDDDADALARVERELTRRHGSDYRVVTAPSPAAARALMEELRGAGSEVALVLADQWMPSATGAEVLAGVSRLFPRARRGLLVEFGAWGDRATASAILQAMAMGHIDYYVLKPWRSPDEFFNRTVSEFLHEWSRGLPSGPREVVVVGPREAQRTYEVRNLLARNGIPFVFHDHGAPEGRRALACAGLDGSPHPVVAFHDGRVLVDPSNVAIADAFGLPTALDATDFDVAVVGAGPAGLAAAVYAASEGLRTLVVERESIGGQAGSSALIRNYLGFSRGIAGAELAMRAYQQAWVFGVSFVLMRAVTGVGVTGDRLALTLSDGARATATAIVLAMGVSYRRLAIDPLEALVGAGVYYGASVSEAQALGGADAYVVGAGNSAGQAAMHLARHARRVTILVRGDSLAASMSRYLIDEIDAAPNVGVRLGAEVVDGGGAGRLEWLVLKDRDAAGRVTVPAAGLFVLIGAHPHTDWLPAAIHRDRWGFVLTGPDAARDASPPLARAPMALETSMPGVFAVGDVRSRSVKRVAASVGDGASVVSQVHELLVERAARRS